ncbi:MAG: AAA family ATPase, partial [Acidobacteriota bacterium]
MSTNGDLPRRDAEESPKTIKARSADAVGALIAAAASELTEDETTVNQEAEGYPRLSAAELLELDLPDPPRLGGPFTESQLVLIYAQRGVGKTFFSMSLSLAIAIGDLSFCGWDFHEGRKVLYVDGEMSLRMMQRRLRDLLAGSGAMTPDGPEVQFELLSSARLWETEGYGIKDLIDEQNRARLEKAIDRSGARVIVLDNLSTLSSGDENSSEEWAPVESWLVKLRAKGLTVILVHHAGKGGQQRGTSRREGPMDLIIKLQRAKNYEATDGCRAEVLFEKCRDAYGTGV